MEDNLKTEVKIKSLVKWLHFYAFSGSDAEVLEEQRQKETEVYYNGEGKMEKQIRFLPDGSADEIIKYEYDQQGRLVAVINEVGGEFGEKTTYEFNDQDQITKEFHHYIDGSFDCIAYRYDHQGRLCERVCLDAEGVTDFTEQTEYDEQGNRIHFTICDEGNIKSYEEFISYNTAGKETKKVIIDHQNNERQTIVFAYNDDDLLASQTVEGVSETRYAYNRHHQLISEETYAEGKLKRKLENIYDGSKMREQKETIFSPGIVSEQRFRHVYEYTYFN